MQGHPTVHWKVSVHGVLSIDGWGPRGPVSASDKTSFANAQFMVGLLYVRLIAVVLKLFSHSVTEFSSEITLLNPAFIKAFDTSYRELRHHWPFLKQVFSASR